MSSTVVQHYTEGSLMSRILEGLSSTDSIDMAAITPQQLHPIDQFHLGGLKALQSLLAHVDITPGCRVLDLGCGLGGTCRVIATQQPEATILGVDLTPEFIEVLRLVLASEQMNAQVMFLHSPTDEESFLFCSAPD